MTPRRSDDRPLVAVVSTVPVLGAAVTAELEDVARVEWLPAGRVDEGLLRSLGVDVLVVDSAAAAAEAAAIASTTELPVVHVSLREERVHVLRDGAWVDCGDDSTGSIRNVLLAALFGKAAVA